MTDGNEVWCGVVLTPDEQARYARKAGEYRKSWDDYPPVVIEDGCVVNPAPNPHGVRFAVGSIQAELRPNTKPPRERTRERLLDDEEPAPYFNPKGERWNRPTDPRENTRGEQ